MKTITLTLKKIYFEQILAGQKIYEYRSDSPFFRARFEHKKYTKIVFHYYKRERLECDVIKVDKVPNPFLNDDLSFLTTSKVFRIHLKNPKLITRHKQKKKS